MMPFDRICPGRWFALRVLFLNISCTLAAFDIEAPVGEKPEPKFHESLTRYVVSLCVSVKISLGDLLICWVSVVSADIPILSNV